MTDWIKITATGGVLSVAKAELMLSSLKMDAMSEADKRIMVLQVAAHTW
jgi:hypothetical protein